MKIGVNARLLTKPFTGIGQYTKNLFTELGEMEEENEYILVVPEKVDAYFPKNVCVKVVEEKRVGTSGMKKTWWEQVTVPDFFISQGVDAAFFTYPCNPWSKDWYKGDIKTFVTVHDCIPWTNKDYRKGLLSKLYHAQTKKAIKMADKIFTVSESSKKDIADVCGVDSRKIIVAYNGASDVYKKPVDSDVLRKVLLRFGLKRGKFALYVGGYDKRKNVPLLAKAYGEFFKKHKDIPLVLAGDCLFGGKLYDSVDENFIVKTGFLSEENLAALYSSCAVFINLSSQEGFNIPLMEAANCGSPIILSDTFVHREIAEDAAIFVDLSSGGIVSAIEKALDSGKSENLTKKLKNLSGKYSWKNCAMIIKEALTM
jgi:glycosyltransferase involved in cell wall biosynthesis